MKIDKYLSVCVELNDLLYELKIVLPKNHTLQKRINKVMEIYQEIFRRLRVT